MMGPPLLWTQDKRVEVAKTGEKNAPGCLWAYEGFYKKAGEGLCQEQDKKEPL